MTQAFLHIRSVMYQNMLGHLLEQSDDREAAGFMFVNSETQDDDRVFKAVEWFPVPEEGFLEVTDHHFALSDWVRADVIKRAHDLDASITEFHSHLSPWPGRVFIDRPDRLSGLCTPRHVASEGEALSGGGRHPQGH